MDRRAPIGSPATSRRLPSFKGVRDLTLGGSGPGALRPGANAAAKTDAKKFVPNLVQRRKEDATAKKAESGSQDDAQRPRKPDAQPTRGGRNAGAHAAASGKPKPDLIQTQGSVFSEGVNCDGLRKAQRGSFGSVKAEPEVIRPTSRPRNVKVDKEAEEKRLKALLRDDFIDDDDDGQDNIFVPVQLPMVDAGKVFADCDVEADVVRRKKKNPLRIDDSDEEDANGESQKMDVDGGHASSSAGKPPMSGPKSKKDAALELTFSDLVRRQKGDLLFIQMPDHLPGKSERCVLSQLPEGYLGKVEVLRSGRTRLRIGGAVMDMDLGTQVGFLQDLVSLDVPVPEAGTVSHATGDLTVLGHVKNRMVVSPNWDSLLLDRSKQLSHSDED